MKFVLAFVVMSLGVTMISAQNTVDIGILNQLPGGLAPLISQTLTNARHSLTERVDSSTYGPFIRATLAYAGLSNLLEPASLTGTMGRTLLRNAANGELPAGAGLVRGGAGSLGNLASLG